MNDGSGECGFVRKEVQIAAGCLNTGKTLNFAEIPGKLRAIAGGAFLKVFASLKQGSAKSPIAGFGGVSSISPICSAVMPQALLRAAQRFCLKSMWIPLVGNTLMH